MTSDFSIKKNSAGSTAPSSGTQADAARLLMSAAQGDQETATRYLSARVTLSNDALNKVLEYGQAISRLSTDVMASRKDLARARIEEIKKRIEVLKKMLALMGPEAAKGVLREIRQLAGQLSAAADTLKQGAGAPSTAGGGVGAMPAPMADVPQLSDSATPVQAMPDAAADAGQGDARGGVASQAAQAAAAYAKVSATTDVATDATTQAGAGEAAASGTADEASAASGFDDAATSQDDSAEETVQSTVGKELDAANLRRSEDRQRGEDARNLREALRDLKALLALAKQKVERGDETARKDAEASEETIEDTVKTVEGMVTSDIGIMSINSP